ncbi:hypothetical protein DZB84_10145 [Bacillus sp. HNG]|uniref:hypothetical protein n=1 Tax=Bacillus sp. HNG TaxID=2293325 RepID=UPI000E2FACA5|nr:hypothetical protein [Bacillus sp. HNG]RFB17416.1 hypothetical protein DZB84_10145 [Bacillus sp. HNG]
MKIVFFVLAIAFSVFLVFLKKEEEVSGDEINPSVFKHFLNTLGFSLMVFFYGWFIFKEDLFLWFTFYAGILFVFLVGLAEKKNKLRVWVVGFILMTFLFCGFRVPTHSHSFQQWVSENKQLYCPSGFDCVKVSTYIDEKENLVTTSEIVPIVSDYTNWYLLFATGYFSYEDNSGKEVHYKGINIAGWWIETSD